MAYGTIKVDNITFTNGGVDESITVSGLYSSTTADITVTGTVSGDVIIGGTTVSGATVSGGVGVFVSGVFASGTAAAPSVSIGTTDNGLYSPATNQVAISTSGTERLRITSDGKVGIGNNNPGDQLVVRSASNTVVRIANEDDSTAKLTFANTGSDNVSISNTNGELYVTAGASNTEHARIDSSGRLLVGTSSARSNFFNGSGSSRVQIEGTDTDTSSLCLISNPGAVQGSRPFIHLAKTRSSSVGGQTIVADDDFLGAIQFSGSDGTEFVSAARISADVDGTPGANDMPGRLVFSTTADGESDPTPRVTIDSSGRLLVGTSTALGLGSGNSALQVSGEDFATGSISLRRSETSLGGPSFLFAASNGTRATPTLVAEDDELGKIRFYGYDGNDWASFGAEITVEVDGTPGLNDMPGRLVFSTTADGDPSPTERMIIDSSGKVGIGTLSPEYVTEIVGGASGAETSILQIRSNYTTDNTATTLRLGNSTVSTAGSGTVEIAAVRTNVTTGSTDLVIRNATGTSVSEKARIDSSGRLLIGKNTSTDAEALFQAYTASGSIRIIGESGSLSNNNEVTLRALTGTGASLRRSAMFVYKHSGITNPCGAIALSQEDGGSDYLWSDNSGILRISSNTAHIGTTSGTVVGTQTSDERIKNILGPVEYGLDTLKQIEPVRFSLKSEPKTEKLGFIAQQVQPLVPQSVFDTNESIEGEPEDAPTKLGMEYVALIPVLVNAIKELSAEVDALKAQLQAQ